MVKFMSEVKQQDDSKWEFLKSHEFFASIQHLLPEDSKRLTYPEWVKLIEQDEKLDSEKLVTFIPNFPGSGTYVKPAGIFIPKFDGFSSPLGSVAAALGDTASTTVDQVVDKATQVVKQQISRAGQEFADFISGGGVNVGGGGDGATTKEGYAGGSNFNPEGLSLGVKPINSSFRTDIVPLGRPKYFNDSLDKDVPLILVLNNVFPELTGEEWSTTDLPKFGDSQSIQRFLFYDIFNDWNADITRKVNLNVFTKTLLTRDYILNFQRITSYCLSVYYFYLSIIAHVNLPENRNEGMIKLYEALSAQDLRDLTTLKRLLAKAPIDPRMNEFVFHYFNNYKQSHLPGSSLYKVTPIPFADSTENRMTTLVDGTVTTCIELLGSKKYKEFIQLFVQAYPDCDSQLLAYTGVHNFDADHLTYVANCPKILHGSSTGNLEVEVPTVTSDDESITYNCHTDAPDGWIQAASGIWHSGKIRGGFGGPKGLANVVDGFASTTSLKTSVVFSGSLVGKTSTYVYWNGGFYPSSYWTDTSEPCAFSTDINRQTNSVQSVQQFGAQLLLPVSIWDTEQTAQQFADLMFTPPKGSMSSRRPARGGRRNSNSEERDS